MNALTFIAELVRGSGLANPRRIHRLFAQETDQRTHPAADAREVQGP